jgi:hypothetical protein
MISAAWTTRNPLIAMAHARRVDQLHEGARDKMRFQY